MLRAMSVVKLNATQEIYLNQSIFIYKSYEKKNVPESTLEFFGSVSRDSSLNHSWILQILSGIVLLKILRLFLNFLPDIALGFIQKKTLPFRYYFWDSFGYPIAIILDIFLDFFAELCMWFCVYLLKDYFWNPGN